MTRWSPVLLAALFACGGDKDQTDPTDHTHETDTDTDTDADTDADTDTDTDTDADTDTGPTGPAAVSIDFRAVVDGVDAACGQTYTTPAGDVTLGDFRFYVSHVALVASDGTEVPLDLDDDGVWQGDGVALLDFEDATGSCALGTAEENHSLRGTIADGDWDGIAFDLGVPFELNHQDVALADPPLNVTAMFWSWQGGYKFLRVDMVNADTLPWHIHLGSTMCVSGGPTSAPTVECGHPNRPRVTLRGFDPTASEVVLDLAALLDGADTLTESAGSPPGCMSNPTDVTECPPVFSNLGLDFATGACTTDCSDQTAFSGL